MCVDPFDLFYDIPGDNIIVSFLYSWSLGVVIADQFILEGRDGLDSLLLESLQTGIKRLLFGEESLNRRQIPAVILRSHLSLLISCNSNIRIRSRGCNSNHDTLNLIMTIVVLHLLRRKHRYWELTLMLPGPNISVFKQISDQ